MLKEHARCLGAMLDPISAQIVKAIDSQCDPPVLLALLQLRQDWHFMLCELLKASVSSEILPPEEMVNQMMYLVGQETQLLRDLSVGFAAASPDKTGRYAVAWMAAREASEELIDFYLDY